jgi:hypothetical protein
MPQDPLSRWRPYHRDEKPASAQCTKTQSSKLMGSFDRAPTIKSRYRDRRRAGGCEVPI